MLTKHLASGSSPTKNPPAPKVPGHDSLGAEPIDLNGLSVQLVQFQL